MRLTIQCFGSQGKSFIPCAFCHLNLYSLASFSLSATLCGLTILPTKWDSTSYRNFGLLMIPYFVFDAYFYSVGALTTLGAVGDGGNTVTHPFHTVVLILSAVSTPTSLRYWYLHELRLHPLHALLTLYSIVNTSLRSVVTLDINIAKKKKKRKGYNYKGGSLFRFI